MGTGPTPPLPGDPPGFVNVGDVASQEVDPRNFGNLMSKGTADSGTWEHMALAFWTAFIKIIAPGISLFFDVVDVVFAAVAAGMQKAQAQSAPGFYELVGHLLTDLTGIEVDGGELFQQFQTRGRVAAMQQVGGALVDTLAGEFAGVFQANEGGVFTQGKGDGIGGLPAVQLSPDQGMNAARAFLGFAMSFAVREGNTDLLASFIPYGLGEGFKDIAEDFSKSIGIGRLTRLALKPLFQNLIAVPMDWAFKQQYRPSLLGADLTIRAFNAGLFTADQLKAELATHGFSDERQNILQAAHTKYPHEEQLQLLELTNQIGRQEHTNLLGRIGYDPDNINLVIKAEGAHVQRQLSIRLAESFLHEVAAATMDLPTYKEVLSRFTLTPNEQDAFVGLATELLNHARRRVTLAQMEEAFVEGIVNVEELEEYLRQRGYPDDDRRILLEITLLKLAAANAKKNKPPKKTGTGSTGSTGTHTP